MARAGASEEPGQELVTSSSHQMRGRDQEGGVTTPCLAQWPPSPAQCVITSQDNVILIPAQPVQSGASVGEMIYFSRTHKHCLKLDLGLEHENIGEFSGTIDSQQRHSSQANNASNNNLMWTFWKINYYFPNNNQNWSMCVSVFWCSCVV